MKGIGLYDDPNSILWLVKSLL